MAAGFTSTRSEIVAQAQMRLPVPRSEAAKPGRADELENILVDMMSNLCDIAEINPRIRMALTTTLTTTLDSSGKVTLASGALANLWIKTIRSAKLYLEGYDRDAAFVHDFGSFLSRDVNPDIPIWAVSGNFIYVRSGDPSRPAESADITIKDALYVPYVDEPTNTLTTLPDTIVQDVVRFIVAEQLSRLGVQTPQQQAQASDNNG